MKQKKQKVIIYILNKKGKPLMPTTRCRHVRILLDNKKAVVVSSNPFTIRLKYDTPNGVRTCSLVLTLAERILVLVHLMKVATVYILES